MKKEEEEIKLRGQINSLTMENESLKREIQALITLLAGEKKICAELLRKVGENSIK